MTLNNASQPVVLLFSGQGNPVIGMGSDLWDLNSTTKQIWDCASDISGLDLRRLCLKGADEQTDSDYSATAGRHGN